MRVRGRWDQRKRRKKPLCGVSGEVAQKEIDRAGVVTDVKMPGISRAFAEFDASRTAERLAWTDRSIHFLRASPVTLRLVGVAKW